MTAKTTREIRDALVMSEAEFYTWKTRQMKNSPTKFSKAKVDPAIAGGDYSKFVVYEVESAGALRLLRAVNSLKVPKNFKLEHIEKSDEK